MTARIVARDEEVWIEVTGGSGERLMGRYGPFGSTEDALARGRDWLARGLIESLDVSDTWTGPEMSAKGGAVDQLEFEGMPIGRVALSLRSGTLDTDRPLRIGQVVRGRFFATVEGVHVDRKGASGALVRRAVLDVLDVEGLEVDDATAEDGDVE